MPHLIDIQKAFIHNIVTQRKDSPYTPPYDNKAARWEVYQHNLFQTLLNHLQEVYKATSLCLGEEEFKNIALQYIQINKPAPHKHFKFYGHTFIEVLSPNCNSFIPELVCFEWKKHAVTLGSPFPAPAQPIKGQDNLIERSLQLAPHVKVTAFSYPIDQIYEKIIVQDVGDVIAPSDTYLLFIHTSKGVASFHISVHEYYVLKLFTQPTTFTRAFNEFTFCQEDWTTIIENIFKWNCLAYVD